MPGLLLCRVRSLFALPFPRKGCCPMARLASIEKAGFYPTPPEETELICSRLTAEPGSKIAILDPCCGEGIALERMANALRKQGADVVSYGIELEEGRAKSAQDHLDHVICSPYEDAMVTPHAFSFMWLNPPYMHYGSERAEVVFLRDLTDPSKGKLQPGGLLGFCIPERILKESALLLAIRFRNLRVYRFTDKNYPMYRQIVVFGYRREKRPATEEIQKAKEWLSNLDAIPALDTDDGIAFAVPPATKEVKTFKPAQPTKRRDSKRTAAVRSMEKSRRSFAALEACPGYATSCASIENRSYSRSYCSRRNWRQYGKPSSCRKVKEGG